MIFQSSRPDTFIFSPRLICIEAGAKPLDRSSPAQSASAEGRRDPDETQDRCTGFSDMETPSMHASSSVLISFITPQMSTGPGLILARIPSARAARQLTRGANSSATGSGLTAYPQVQSSRSSLGAAFLPAPCAFMLAASSSLNASASDRGT